MAEIKFKTRTSFLGRNGVFSQDGLIVTQFGDAVTLAPVTSKNAIGRARVSVPSESIPELINILQTMLKP